MAFIMVRIEIPAVTVGTLNDKITDSTKPHEGVNQLIDLLSGLTGGAWDGDVAVAVRNSTETITAADGGFSAIYDLT